MLRYPTNSEMHKYMKEMQVLNKGKSKTNKAENWFNDKLKRMPIKFSRQAIWGYRLFDFWIPLLGIAIEIDGPEHETKKEYDKYRDDYNFKRSGIIVLRVKNFNEEDAIIAISKILKSDTWIDRRASMGLLTKAQKEKYTG